MKTILNQHFMRSFFLICFSFFLCAQASAVIRYVKQGGSGAGDGSSWANASGNLQAMIDASSSGDEVWVAAGIYKPTSGTDRTVSFVMRNGVAIYGGFPNAGDPGMAQRDWVVNVTTLSGDLNGNDGPGFVNIQENSYHVIFNNNNGLNNTAILDGFTISGGNAEYNPSDPSFEPENEYGGGMYNASSSPTIANCTFSGNYGVFGGGMYNTDSSPALTNCSFSGNGSTDGGGMLNEDASSPGLAGCDFINNTSAGGTGGMANYSSASPALTACLFSGNSGAFGGGMYNTDNAPTLANCIFFGNTATGYNGGGMYNSASSPALFNCTFYGNSTTFNGGGIANENASSPTVTNCIFWGNGTSIFNDNSTSAVTYSIVQQASGVYPGAGNLNEDPLFVDAANGNLRLQPCSPAIDAGDNAAVPAGITADFGGYARLFNATGSSTVDMGAFEYQSSYDACTACLASGNILYVKANASGNNDGSSWADAFNGLKEALALAASCPNVTEIWVAEGTYKPTSGTDRNLSFSMQNGVAIYGGFPNTGAPTFADRDWAAHETILSGDIGTPGDNSDNSIHIISNSNLDASAVLDGFTLSGGNANGFSIPTQEGGAIVNQQSSPTINNCTFINNFGARNGAAVMNATNCSPVFTNCLFTQNTNGGAGDGVIFDYNGGGSLLINCTLSGNSTRNAVLGNFFNASTQVQNCILWNNSNNNFFGDFTISHSIVQGGFPAGTNILDEDPLFVDAANGDLRLRECSPAIDAGDNAANSSSLGLDGNPRVFNATGAATIDLGAYEYPSSFDFASSCTILYVNDDASGNNDGSSWTDAFNDLQNALNQARNNPSINQIWVAEGTYKPTSTSDRTVSFSMVNGVGLYGGFPGLPGQEGDFSVRDWAANETVLSGDIGTVGVNTDNSYRVINNHGGGLDNTAILNGFIIQDAYNPNLGNGSQGGGIRNTDASPLFLNCIIRNNFSNSNGGGLYTSNASPTFVNCIFANNIAGNHGGGAYVEVGTFTFTNCVFYGNSSQSGTPGGLSSNLRNTEVLVTNSILWSNFSGNQAPSSSAQIEFDNGALMPTLSHSIVQGGYAPCTDCPGGDGNVDPFFVDAANGNLRLQECSPAIDAGDNAAVPSGIMADLDGAPRFFNNGTVDLGAYEYQSAPAPIPAAPPFTADNGLHFDGIDDCVEIFECGAAPLANGGDAITIEYWFKGTSNQSAVRFQLDNNTYVVAGWNGLHILSNDGGLNGIAVGAAATDGAWHHVAMAWQRNTANGFRSYLDGRLVEQRNSSDTPLPAIATGMYLGALNGTSEFMNGTLDEVRIWNVARTQAEIQAGICNGVTAPQENLLVHYTFDHGTANGDNTGINTLANSAGSAYAGVLHNFALSGNSSNWTEGKVIPTVPIRYVKAGGTGDGTSWVNASGDLQAMINTCNVEQVWVAAGTYKPTSGNDRSISFVMKNGVAIYGGFPNTGDPDFTNRDWVAHETILSGDLNNDDDITGSGSTLSITNNEENSYHVILNNQNGLDNTAVLDGFTITGGNANTNPLSDFLNSRGGGMYNDSSSPMVVNCTFSGNSTSFVGGGGMYNNNSSPTVTNCTFSGNSASFGGGGGMYNNNEFSSPLVTNCIFSGNSARFEGGGMLNFTLSSPVVTNCTFSGNSAGTIGGGMYNDLCEPTVTNCIFWDNGNEITNESGATPTVTYSIVQGGYTPCTDCPGGDGNVCHSSPTQPTAT
ncbi:MAG: hypothetical protein H6573_06460 [Lewinellaceae bacterium]|nr:hypothetical protein [Lewinellaceae bacterium]